MPDLSTFLDFMEEAGDGPPGFDSPPMPSREHPGGRSYRIPAPDAMTGLRLNTLADMTLKVTRGVEVTEVDVKRLRLDDQEEREFLEMVLGDALAAMVADGVAWPHVQRMGMYAFVFYGISEEAANKAAENGLFRGNSSAPTNRASRRGATRTSGASAGSKTTTRKR